MVNVTTQRSVDLSLVRIGRGLNGLDFVLVDLQAAPDPILLPR